GMSARRDPPRRDLIIFAIRRRPAGGLCKVAAQCPPELSPPPTRGRVKLALEHAACGAVDRHRITARGYRNQHHTLWSEEIVCFSRRQPTANERFDLVAIEPLHPKMRSEPFIDEIGRCVFGAREKTRMGQQPPGRKSMRPQRDPLDSLVKLLDLIIRKAIGVCEQINSGGRG